MRIKLQIGKSAVRIHRMGVLLMKVVGSSSFSSKEEVVLALVKIIYLVNWAPGLLAYKIFTHCLAQLLSSGVTIPDDAAVLLF